MDLLNQFFKKDIVEIVGFGSLLSPRSAKTTFPNLTNFRVVKIKGWRRVFCHPARGIAEKNSPHISSLSTEKDDQSSFLAVVFSVSGESPESFLAREEEFDFVQVTYEAYDSTETGSALMCTRSSDQTYLERWGQQQFDEKYKANGLETIWSWGSSILPCSVYLRHVYLAAKALSKEVLDSFLDDTYLADRKTTIRTYLIEHPEVLETLPTPECAERYSG